MPSLPIDPDDAPSAEIEGLTVGQARAREAVIRALHDAFPARRPRRFDPFVNSLRGGEPAEVEEFLGPVEDWTTIDRDCGDWGRLWIADSAIYFLSDEAVCFYLPVLLIDGLHSDCNPMGPVTGHLTHSFLAADREKRWSSGETYEAAGRQRWAGLTPPQVRAVILWLEWFVLLGGPDTDRDIVEALDRYWRPRAAAGL